MSKHFCNPVNIEYRFQFEDSGTGPHIFRESADPSLIQFKGKYWLFPSMTAGFLTSEDLVTWEKHSYINPMPIHDYAPDVRAIGEYMYFCASKGGTDCPFYRSKDPVNEPFEEIPGSFPFWDPDMFPDDDGRLYFYWGCSNENPIWGTELDPVTLKPLMPPVPLFNSNAALYGYERRGDDHTELTRRPHVEGAWMTKYNGKYYLQYAFPGTEYNIYGDGVYVSDRPLGPFTPAKNNPFSYKPGGFINGAGHGSTLCDLNGDYWHISTMRISINHMFERRLGLWKAGFDADGELYCDQRYGDWPIRTDAQPFEKPDWLLLSYGKAVTVSSGTGAEYVTDEDCRTWWKAAPEDKTPCVTVDLGTVGSVHAVQVNFAEEIPVESVSEQLRQARESRQRIIEAAQLSTGWLLEGSADGNVWSILADRRDAAADFTHELVELPEGMPLRFIRLSITATAYNAPACVSGLRVFGIMDIPAPRKPRGVKIERISPLDALIEWEHDPAACAHNILWGYAPDKLYHSYLVFGRDSRNIGALTAGQAVWFRVDSVNEAGITEGEIAEIP